MDEYMNSPAEDTNNVETANESKADRFKRLATPRVNKILHSLDTLGNCSGSGYEYTDEQVQAMFGAIEEKVNETRAKFEKKQTKASTFTF